MSSKILKPKQALNKAFLKVKPNRNEIEDFKSNLTKLIDHSNEIESEEFHKNLVIDFLKKTYYDPSHFVNTKGRNDLVIHTGDKAKSRVGVIIEAKKPTNKSEMLSKTNINYKAFQELVLYYLRERITQKNLEVKRLVVTNIHEWFIFDALIFDRHFAQNKGLVKQFEDFEAGRLAEIKTDFFYKNIAEPAIEKVKDQITFTYFDIRDYNKPLRNQDKKDDAKLIALFKLLSPEHLLKLPFANDSNSLDKRFYSELLHIIGLTETKQGGKKLIERSAKGNRNTGSILEDAIIQLDTYDKISLLEKPSQYGNTTVERLFNVGLELSITWINRVLFLKLLEAQLISYHKGDKSYAFLSKKNIHDWDDLNSLFFQVLAKKTEDRNEDVKALFAKVPYLNSSLFEPTAMEQKTIMVNFLKNEKTIPVISSTVLKDAQGKKLTGELTTLEYLFRFLDAYDFASEGSEEIQEDNKTLINASVLGLIFEKINGYKDGSFFTPGFITMYMCRETIRKAVIQKFKEAKGWEVENQEQLYDKIEDRAEANELVNSLKICDPAVGSGHFLVSALNEIIAVKNDLKILQDRTGKRLKEYQVEVVNDELIVTDEDGELFEYNPNNKESQRIQETLFHEKQTIIENCLFGVDINPNSVKICRLRLWIELLKSAYYKSNEELETLPNIDINIKCGNSLVSRFGLEEDLSNALKKSKFSIDAYKIAVDRYRNAESKAEKREMENLINAIKSDFRSEIAKNDPKIIRKAKLGGELYNLTMQTGLFEESAKEKKTRLAKIDKVSKELEKLETEIEEIKANQIFENAFEWRFEFPEVLNDEGDFVGFDVVIGNPPYIRIQELEHSLIDYYKKNFSVAYKRVDISILFFERAHLILSNIGICSFIASNQFITTEYGKNCRSFIQKTFKPIEIIDYQDLPVFEDALTYVSVFTLTNLEVDGFNYHRITSIQDAINNRYGIPIHIETSNLNKDNWSLKSQEETRLLQKIHLHDSLEKYAYCHYGIITGADPVFNLSKEKVEKLGLELELVLPLIRSNNCGRYKTVTNDQFVLYPYEKSEGQTKLIPIDILEAKFPNTYTYLLSNKSILEKRKDSRKTFEDKSNWYSLTRFGNLKVFEGKKIVYPGETKNNKFGVSESVAGYSGARVFGISLYKENDSLFNELVAILNSKIAEYILHNKASLKQGGYYSYSSSVINSFPLPKLGNIKIQSKAKEILNAKKKNPSEDTIILEKEIDKLVYELYGLNEEEIGIVEGGER
ncbi:DUF7149 domain-containing protein [Cyclobacterium marinum]|uniref:DUF7149 domain-containing protein n=1 Tax=Cyclobacterium marinum TaxID=104 RepID=UPI0011EDC5D1|nr:DNA methyltransferase [Cyclobacterium marinum]MBI0397791.1 class I SAM-dependent DNA methyltransferase [Cyclobacterium marinum]